MQHPVELLVQVVGVVGVEVEGGVVRDFGKARGVAQHRRAVLPEGFKYRKSKPLVFRRKHEGPGPVVEVVELAIGEVAHLVGVLGNAGVAQLMLFIGGESAAAGADKVQAGTVLVQLPESRDETAEILVGPAVAGIQQVAVGGGPAGLVGVMAGGVAVVHHCHALDRHGEQSEYVGLGVF